MVAQRTNVNCDKWNSISILALSATQCCHSVLGNAFLSFLPVFHMSRDYLDAHLGREEVTRAETWCISFTP